MTRVRKIPILMYHQTAATPPKGSPLRGLVVAPATFARHMAAMAACGYRGMSMSDLEPYLAGEKTGRVFGITFDDGYENTLVHALPVLRRYGFTSTCYAVADLVGSCNVWDAGHGIAQVPLMDVAQLQQWIDAGQEVGSHTLSHANLADIDDDQRVREIVHSKTKLEAMLNQQQGVRHFCYPYGALNPAAVDCVRASGYATATTTVRGRVIPGLSTDMMLLSRVLVSRTTSWPQLLAKCLTAYEDKRAGGAY